MSDSVETRERGNIARDHECKASLGHCNFPVFVILGRPWLSARRRTEGHVLASSEATVLGAVRRAPGLELPRPSERKTR